jgi:hypothetical protein
LQAASRVWRCQDVARHQPTEPTPRGRAPSPGCVRACLLPQGKRGDHAADHYIGPKWLFLVLPIIASFTPLKPRYTPPSQIISLIRWFLTQIQSLYQRRGASNGWESIITTNSADGGQGHLSAWFWSVPDLASSRLLQRTFRSAMLRGLSLL